MKPGDFKVIKIGAEYTLPAFGVVEGKGLQHVGFNTIYFVRGSKLAKEEVEPMIGVTHESLLEMMILDLRHKNCLVPSRETALTITKLEEALAWQKRRQELRARDGIQGTYKVEPEEDNEHTANSTPH
jgi:hypothetical protein